MPPPVKVLLDDDPNRLRNPETFVSGSGIEADSLANPLENSIEINTMETETEEGTKVSEKKGNENNENGQDSEDSEEDSDDDIVVAAGNFTLSSMENNMISQQNNASQSTAGINLKRNNLLTLTNIPGISAGNKVS